MDAKEKKITALTATIEILRGENKRLREEIKTLNGIIADLEKIIAIKDKLEEKTCSRK